jgi:uncharacterized membrane protein YraQ (UPF0718 family)
MSVQSPDLAKTPWRFPAVDRVWLAIAVILLLTAFADWQQAQASLAFTLASLLSVAPFLLASVAFTAGAEASGADTLIARAFSGRVLTMIVLAALIGGLSPLCSCGVIPLIAALLAIGVPLAPVMAFWLSSPVIDPAMFAMTAGLLGPGFAIAKSAIAVGLGLFGGFAIAGLMRAGLFADPLRPEIGKSCCSANSVLKPQPISWRFWSDEDRRRTFAASGAKALGFLGKWLTLAFVLESLMLAYVPAESIAMLVGGDGIVPVVIATVVGVPAYLNGYAALPLVDGLIGQGMAPGAGMAFLVAGGVTSLPAAIAVFALARLPLFATYIALALTGSLAAGLLYGMVV